MFMVSADGAKAMQFSSDFSKYARAQGVRDPFEVSRKLFAKKCRNNADGSIGVTLEWDEETGKVKIDPEEPTRAEKDAWIRMRDEYIARRCFYEIGYDMFLAHTKPGDTYDISYMRDLDEFVPCRSADRQCAMFCKNIGGNCNEENL